MFKCWLKPGSPLRGSLQLQGTHPRHPGSSPWIEMSPQCRHCLSWGWLLIFPLPASLFLPLLSRGGLQERVLGLLLLPCPIRAAGAAGRPRHQLCLPFALPAPAGPSPSHHNPLVPAAATQLPSLLPAPPYNPLGDTALLLSRLVPSRSSAARLCPSDVGN